MIYASTKEQLSKALDVKLSIHTDSLDEVEWKTVLNVASGVRLRVSKAGTGGCGLSPDGNSND